MDALHLLNNIYPEQLSNKKILSKKERKNSEIFFNNGLAFKKASNQILDTIEDNKLLLDQYKNFLIVMDKNGKIYACPRKLKGLDNNLEIKHPDIIQGEPAAFAGEILCIKGSIMCLNNLSGHYKPKLKHTKAFIQHIENMGADLTHCEILSYFK
jgi:hypothetical protein